MVFLSAVIHVWVLHSFCGWMILHCMHMSHFIYSFITDGQFELFSPFDYYEECCLWMLMYKHLSICFQFFWGYIPRAGLGGSCAYSLFNLLSTCKLSPQWLHHFTLPKQCTRVPISPYLHRLLLLSAFIILAIQIGINWQLIIVLIWVFLMTMLSIFSCAYCLFLCRLWRNA